MVDKIDTYSPKSGRIIKENGDIVNEGDLLENTHNLLNSGIDVALQDQHTDIIGLYLGELIDTTTVLSNTEVDDTTIDIETTGAVPVVGNYLCLQELSKITQVEIISVTPITGNQYTLEISVPLDYAYTTDGGCSILNINMNANGSVTSKEFAVGPLMNYRWDLTQMMVSMILSTAGDDGLFGNISKLSKGIYFRKENHGDNQNIFNIQDNSDFAIEGYDVDYTTRSGGQGSYGMRSRIPFAGQHNRGVVVRLDGSKNEKFLAVVRDDLTGIASFRVKVLGHIVED
jgi:hypothetical protein